MPELPEVETVVQTLCPRIVGQRIEAMRLLRGDYALPAGFDWPAALAGRTVRGLTRRAKRIVFALDAGQRFYVHLGMTGRLVFTRRGEPSPPHTHAELDFRAGRLLCVDPRRFGGMVWTGDGPVDEGLGPEPLGLRPAGLGRLLGRTSRCVKVALLDQRLIAGLGNIYVDESLHAAGIHPQRPADSLAHAEIGRLSRAIKLTLRRAIRHRGSSVRDYVDGDGLAGGFQKLHRVYDRAGLPCPACRGPVQRIVLGGRSTHLCPRCQPAPGSSARRATRSAPPAPAIARAAPPAPAA